PLILDPPVGRREPVLVAHFPDHELRLEETRLASRLRVELERDDRDLIAHVHRRRRRQDEAAHEVEGFDQVALAGGVRPVNGCALEQTLFPKGDAVFRVPRVRTGDETEGLRRIKGAEVADTKFDQHDGTPEEKPVRSDRVWAGHVNGRDEGFSCTSKYFMQL